VLLGSVRNTTLVVNSRILKCAALAAFLTLQTPISMGLGGDTAQLHIIQTQTEFVRRTATEYQRRVAEQNAKAFFKQLTPAKRQELKKKHVKTVLVPTVRAPQTAPEAKEVRMRFSFDGESLADDSAYEFKTPLKAGTVAAIVSSEPEYVCE
jgi:hypothetical protein